MNQIGTFVGVLLPAAFRGVLLASQTAGRLRSLTWLSRSRLSSSPDDVSGFNNDVLVDSPSTTTGTGDSGSSG